jgi:hypothetical protein
MTALLGSLRTRIDELLWLAYALVVLWLVLPLERFPSQDGPAHVYQAHLLRALLLDPQSVYHRYFVLAAYPQPNVAGHVLLAGLMTALPPEWAEKLLVVGYLLLFPWAVRYAASPRVGGWVMVWTLPLAPSFLLHMGFYNFCLGMLLLLLSVGFWQRRQARPSAISLLALAWLLLAIYFSHLMALAAAYLLLALVSLVPAPQAGVAAGKRIIGLALAAVPSFLLVLGYLLSQSPGSVAWPDFKAVVRDYGQLSGLWSYALAEMELMRVYAFATVCLACVLFWRRADASGGGWLAAALLFALGSFVAPDALAGGGLVRERCQFLTFLCLPLGAAQGQVRSPWPGLAGLARALGAGVAACQLWLLAGAYAAHRPYHWDEGSLPEQFPISGQTLLTMRLKPHVTDARGAAISLNVDAFRHAASYLSVRRNLVMLDHYAGHAPGFQVRLRSEVDPYAHLGAKEMQAPTRLDVRGYEQRTGILVAVVLVWGVQTSPEARQAYRARLDPEFVLYRQMNTELEVWRRAPAKTPPKGERTTP